MSEQDQAAPPGQPDEAAGGVPVEERLFGWFGLAAAVGLALIAADLVSGGALSRMVRAGGGDGGDAAGHG